MYSDLPREILHQIFCEPNIARKDLLQLQLTCKQWSSAAQQRLYKEIRLDDDDLYTDKIYDYDAISDRLQLLIQTLLFCDMQIKNHVKIIWVDTIFELEDPLSKFVTLAFLCPNITTLCGTRLPAEFYKALPTLYHSGNLQKVEFIQWPNYYKEGRHNMNLTSSYLKAIAIFRNTIKEIVIADSVGKRVMADDELVLPDHLQQFPRVEHLQMEEFSRFHLFHMKHYLSNCHPSVYSIHISMYSERVPYSDIATLKLLSAKYNDPSAINPQPQVRTLSIELTDAPLTTNEMDFIMRMFPSLESFTLTFDKEEAESSAALLQQQHVDVATRFFKYLSLIPRFQCQGIWFGTLGGIGPLSRLVESIDFQHLSIVNTTHSREDLAAVSISLHRNIRRKRTVLSKTAKTWLSVGVYSNDETTPLWNTLQYLKCGPVQNLTLGSNHSYQRPDFIHTLTEDSLNYIMQKFISLRRLTFRSVEFPSKIHKWKGITVMKQLHHFQLSYCKISEDCLRKISKQLDYVGQFIFLTSKAHEEQIHNEANSEIKIQISLPYTTIDTMRFSIMTYTNYFINVWADRKKRVNLNVAGDDASDACSIFIHCKSLKKICINANTFDL